jgi:hypothetical protein
MSKPGKQKSSNSSREHRPKTPPVFFPAALSDPYADFKFTDSQFEELEKAGGVKLSEQQRANLLTLALFWISDLRLRRSARPKQFRECLEKMEEVFASAEEVCRWDHGLEYHLVHWAMETSVRGAERFPAVLASLENDLQTVRQTVVGLIQCLPPDPGRQRPFDDERRITFLINIFENSGGKATAYLTEHHKAKNKPGTMMADTPFRRFAQQFYSLLPAADKRDPGGLDEALRLAVNARRAQRPVTS